MFRATIVGSNNMAGIRAVMVTATLYFGIIFASAFVAGVARVLVIVPRVGPTAAVLLEVPILLAASWFLARRLLRDRPLGLGQRLAVGGISFALLMTCEALLSALMSGQSISEWTVTVASPLEIVGLAGQLGFAAIPVFAASGRTRPTIR